MKAKSKAELYKIIADLNAERTEIQKANKRDIEKLKDELTLEKSLLDWVLARYLIFEKDTTYEITREAIKRIMHDEIVEFNKQSARCHENGERHYKVNVKQYASPKIDDETIS